MKMPEFPPWQWLAWFLAGLGIALAGAAFQARAHTPQPVKPAQVREAAWEFEVPLEMLLAVWEEECQYRPTCPRGPAGEWGPFQIMRIAAVDAGCAWEWRGGPGNARCAAKILARAWQRCAWRRRGAFSRYNLPAARCRATAYAWRVEQRMIALQRQAAHNREIELLEGRGG